MYSNKRNDPATVVCLHSSMSHGGQWRALVNRLENDFNVLTPNLLGYSGANDGFENDSFDHQLRLEDEVSAVMQQIEKVDGPVRLLRTTESRSRNMRAHDTFFQPFIESIQYE